jgi:hypothetical protein
VVLRRERLSNQPQKTEDSDKAYIEVEAKPLQPIDVFDHGTLLKLDENIGGNL